MQTIDRKAFEDRNTIASILAPVRVPPELIGPLSKRQLQSVKKLGVLMVLTHLLNAALVMVLFMPTAAGQWLGLWASGLSLFCAMQFMTSISTSSDLKPRSSSPGASRRGYVIGAFVFGCLWGVLPVIVVPHADNFGLVAIAVLSAGLVFGGASVLSRLPAAAYCFILPIGTGFVFSLLTLSDPRTNHLMTLVLVYLIIIVVCVRWDHNQFVAQFINEAAVNEQNALIGLLLRDFEESSADWLWQTGADRRLVALPLSLDDKKNGYTLMQDGCLLESLFEPGEARNVLMTSMKRHQGFRDLVLKVMIDDEECWWSVTGKPILEDKVFKGFRGVVSDVTQSKKIEDRIAYLAHFDGLTGLPNRATFQEKLEKACRKPVDEGSHRAILWIDLDNFKWVNDTLGHPAGDELLRQFADRIGRGCEDEDIIARLGGDEFAAIVERPSRVSLERFLDDLVDRLVRPYELFGSTASCGASIGVRGFDSEAGDPQSLLCHADLALYKAKKQGKGTWCEFTSELEEKTRARRMIETDLHKALGQNELLVKFQPIVDAVTCKVMSCETLMRWEHPKRGMISPGEFIEHAEDCGLITRMGDWVIREALAQARQLPENVSVSVNVSPVQLHSTSLVSTIINALARNSIDPSRLDLEITESVLMSDTSFVLERLQQLKSLGLKISLDDFGTGFSSLSYLRSFPFDKIKIDKSFVSDIEQSEDSRVITRTTIGLAHSLGMRCTAEGVETDAQRDFLVEQGCDELQGFLISRARPLEELSHLLDFGDRPDRPVREADNGLHLIKGDKRKMPSRRRQQSAG